MSKAEAGAYINSHLNKVNGYHLASQRPLVFHGAVGQAVGLFQSYQFHFTQRMLKYVENGGGKDAITAMAMQTSIYGLQGLPGFAAINQHIIGNASGNREHTDMYSVTYGALGKDLGDLLTFGLASSVTGVNIYSRGDINPRQATVLPVNPFDIPVVQVPIKAFGNVMNTTKQLLAGGAAWETILQGIEHNGINRPLAGFAQVAQAFGPEGEAYSTTGAGKTIATNELMSWATLGRIAGGKPLQDAIMQDALFRSTQYALTDGDKKKRLSEAFRSHMIQGNAPTPEVVNEFMGNYMKLGYSQKDFVKWATNIYKDVDVGIGQQIADNLRNPYARTMQRIMGGVPPEDVPIGYR